MDFIASLIAAAVGLAITLGLLYITAYVLASGACAATPIC
jgi:hypothetical protein